MKKSWKSHRKLIRNEQEQEQEQDKDKEKENDGYTTSLVETERVLPPDRLYSD